MNIEELNLQKFVGFRTKNSEKISITKSFSFGFPPSFFTENNLANYSFVELYFDQLKMVIALHFSPEKTDSCFKLIKYGEGEKRGASLVAKSFFTRYRLDPKTIAGKYEAQKLSKEGIGDLFAIQIKEHETASTETDKEMI